MLAADPKGSTTWVDVGNPEGAGNETGPSISTQMFYTSGANAQFTIINGAYQPVIAMTVGSSALVFINLACESCSEQYVSV